MPVYNSKLIAERLKGARLPDMAVFGNIRKTNYIYELENNIKSCDECKYLGVLFNKEGTDEAEMKARIQGELSDV